MLVSIDPGLRSCGVAIWRKTQLYHAAHVKSLGREEEVAEQWLLMADTLWNHVIETSRKVGARTEDRVTIAIEKPQVYARSRSKGDPNDLINLAGVVGAITELLGRSFDAKVVAYLPAEHKGNVPKEVTADRMFQRLTDMEKGRLVLPAKSLQHNVFDAVWIGLYHLGRA